MGTFRKHVSKANKSKLKEESAAFNNLSESFDPSMVVTANIPMIPKRESGIISQPRASSILKSCLRQHILGTVYQCRIEKYVPFRDRVTFGLGDAIHYWVQNTPWLFPDDRRVGWWFCRACEKTRLFGIRPTTKCENCGASSSACEYQEHGMEIKQKVKVRYVNRKTNKVDTKLVTIPVVSGHMDLFLAKDTYPALRVNELKSISSKQFPDLKAPLADHEHQVITYMEYLNQDPNMPAPVDDQVGYVTYISKRHDFKNIPIKMFAVENKGPVAERIAEKVKLYVRGLKHFPDHLAPPVGECERNHFGNYRAKHCPVREDCMRYL